jgi:hypothetical protein
MFREEIPRRSSPSYTESDLRKTAIDEYFASCHKAAVIGGEEQGHGGGFIRVPHTTEWSLIGETSKECLLHSCPC